MEESCCPKGHDEEESANRSASFRFSPVFINSVGSPPLGSSWSFVILVDRVLMGHCVLGSFGIQILQNSHVISLWKARAFAQRTILPFVCLSGKSPRGELFRGIFAGFFLEHFLFLFFSWVTESVAPAPFSAETLPNRSEDSVADPPPGNTEPPSFVTGSDDIELKVSPPSRLLRMSM